jgi:hypothetical protein
LLPAFDSGGDAFWIGRPNERFWVGVGVGDEAVDGELQVDDGLEYAALEALARELAQNSSTALSQDAEVGVKWSRQDDGGAPHVLLRCAAVGDDRLKLTRSTLVTFTTIPALMTRA